MFYIDTLYFHIKFRKLKINFITCLLLNNQFSLSDIVRYKYNLQVFFHIIPKNKYKLYFSSLTYLSHLLWTSLFTYCNTQ